MKVNLFKIDAQEDDSTLETLINELELSGYDNVSNLDYEGIEYNLYIEQKPRRNILWIEELNKVFNFGGISKNLGEINNGVLVINAPSKNIYAITFGHSYHFIHEYCDRNFALDFAESELKSADVDTKSSDFIHGIKIKELVNLKDNSTPTSIGGESFKFVGGIPNSQIFGKRIDCGYSIHFGRNFSFEKPEDIKELNNLIIETERTINKKEKLFKFPRITYLPKSNPLNIKLNNLVKEELICNSENIEIYTSSFTVLGSTVLMNSDNYSYSVYVKGKFKKTIEKYDIISKECIVDYFNKYKSDIDDIDSVKVIVEKIEGNIELKAQSIKRYIFASCELNGTEYLLSDNRWGYINQTFYETLEKSLNTISETCVEFGTGALAVDYDDEDDYIDKVVSSTKFNKLHKLFIYLNGVPFEIADLLEKDNNNLITVKLGSKNQEFIYSFDQAISSATFLTHQKDYQLYQKLVSAKFDEDLIEKIFSSKGYFVLLGFEQKSYHELIQNNDFNLNMLNSFLLKLKIVSWVSLMKNTDMIYKIILI